jgi:hypothetical protein
MGKEIWVYGPLLHGQIGRGRGGSIHFDHHGLNAGGHTGGDLYIHLVQTGETWRKAAELDGSGLSGDGHVRLSQRVG